MDVLDEFSIQYIKSRYITQKNKTRTYSSNEYCNEDDLWWSVVEIAIIH